jgi:hypothetical protein
MNSKQWALNSVTETLFMWSLFMTLFRTGPPQAQEVCPKVKLGQKENSYFVVCPNLITPA